jgi:hypothetical protein
MSRTGRGVLRPRVLESDKGCRRKAVRPALDDVDDARDLGRLKLNHDLLGLPVFRDEVESRRDRFGYAVLGSPLGPGVIELDSVTIGGGVVGT